MYVDEILTRLDGVRSRGPAHWVAKCPAHEDRTPSLSIVEKPDGRILMHDFGGCGTLSVLDSLGLSMSDLYPTPLAKNLPAQRSRAHLHAARDVLALLAREALVVAIAAEDVHDGRALSEVDRARLWEAVVVIREAVEII